MNKGIIKFSSVQVGNRPNRAALQAEDENETVRGISVWGRRRRCCGFWTCSLRNCCGEKTQRGPYSLKFPFPCVWREQETLPHDALCCGAGFLQPHLPRFHRRNAFSVKNYRYPAREQIIKNTLSTVGFQETENELGDKRGDKTGKDTDKKRKENIGRIMSHQIVS